MDSENAISFTPLTHDPLRFGMAVGDGLGARRFYLDCACLWVRPRFCRTSWRGPMTAPKAGGPLEPVRSWTSLSYWRRLHSNVGSKKPLADNRGRFS